MKEWFKARNVWGAAISALSDEEAGRVAKAIWAYTMNGELIEIEGAGKGIFAMILMTLGQDEEHDSDISAKRSNASRSRRMFTNENKTEQMISNDSKSDQLISNDDNKNKNKNKNKSKNKEKEQEQDILFDRFWDAYPRHVNKPAAKKAFLALKPDEELLAKMILAIEKQKQSSQWQEVQYIPHPTTWLHGRRWEDDVAQGKPIRAVTAQEYTQRDYSDEDEDAKRRMLMGVIA